MGVYIKRMKMPKECGECPLYSNIDDVCQFDQTDTCYDKKRPLWCPLVEVPEPHGRLIEAPDVGEYEVFDEDTGTREISLLGLMECHRMVEDAKTIIEAEGE